MPIVVRHGPSAGAISGVGSAIGAAQFQQAQAQLGLQLAGLLQQQQLTREKIDASERQQLSSQIAAMNRLVASGQIQAGRDATRFQQGLIGRQMDNQARQLFGEQQFGRQVALEGARAREAGRARDQQRQIQIDVHQAIAKAQGKRQRENLRQKREFDRASDIAKFRFQREQGRVSAGIAQQLANNELSPQQAVAALQQQRAELGALTSASDISALFPPDEADEPGTLSVMVPGMDGPLKVEPGSARLFTQPDTGQQMVAEWTPNGVKVKPIEDKQAIADVKALAEYEKNVAGEVRERIKDLVAIKEKAAGTEIDANGKVIERPPEPVTEAERKAIRKQVLKEFTRPGPPLEHDDPSRETFGITSPPPTAEEPPPSAYQGIKDRATAAPGPPPAPPTPVNAPQQQLPSEKRREAATLQDTVDEAVSTGLPSSVATTLMAFGNTVDNPAIRTPEFLKKDHASIAGQLKPEVFESLPPEEQREAMNAVTRITRFMDTMDRPHSPPDRPEQTDMLEMGALYFPIADDIGAAWFAVWDGTKFIPVKLGGNTTDEDVADGAGPLNPADPFDFESVPVGSILESPL